MSTTYQWNRYDEYKTLNDRVGEYYATVHQCLAQAIEHTLTDRCQLGLDIACGHGESTRLLSRFADRVVGVDSSDELIRIAREHELGDKFEFECCSFEDFVPPAEKFDIVTAAWYLNHVHTEEAVQGVIEKICQVLRPGGTVAMVVPGDAFTSRRTQAIGLNSFGWKQAWYEETSTFTRGVFDYGDDWIPTTVWQPTWLMRQLNEHFEIRSWDVKGTMVAEQRLVGLDVEPPFEILYGQLR
jgi:2-polyprenyl-3-methyl-5-hydroxy-6-metoxy-1,4-benzoquinol methylase